MRDRVCERCEGDVKWKRIGGDSLGTGGLLRRRGEIVPDHCLASGCPNFSSPTGQHGFDWTIPRPAAR